MKIVKFAAGVSAVVMAISAINVILGVLAVRAVIPPMIEINGKMPPFSITQDLTPKLYDPSVRLEDPKHGFFCSGAVISDDYVLTAAHCLINLDPFAGRVGIRKTPINIVGMTLKGARAASVVAVAGAVNNRADYALVKGDFRDFTKVRIQHVPNELLSTLGLSVGVLTCGYPWGSSFACYPMRGLEVFFEHMAGPGLMYPGMSGGPVVALNMVDGPTVIGVNTAVGSGFVVISTLVGLFDTLGVEVKQ